MCNGNSIDSITITPARKIVCVLFTPFPYEFYDEANRVSNFAQSGIGSGLIEAQRDFWVSNCSLLFIFYYKNNPDFFYLNIGLSIFCGILYTMSFAKVIDLIKKI
jgi:hypothetical protein